MPESAETETTAPAEPTGAGEPRFWTPGQRRPLMLAFFAALLVVAIALILQAWSIGPFAGAHEETDNAYVRGRTTVIAPQVSGYVAEVLVKDYAVVRKGDVLVRIDDAIYRARVAQARANLASALAALANNEQSRASRAAAVLSQSAAVANAEAQLQRAKADMRRVDELVSDGSVSKREQDQTTASLAQAQAAVRQATAGTEIARQDVRTVDVGREGLVAQVDAARAQLQLAEIDLEHTVIQAPEDGQLGEVGVRLGQYVTNGTQLMALVPPERWVIVNFKERQTAQLAIGQRASFTVDALADRRFVGVVEKISPAAGSEFAVLRPDNATGNFVKVPQRIGVRLAIDPRQPDFARLRPGMSVVVAIDVASRP